jgi:hypothetical protein
MIERIVDETDEWQKCKAQGDNDEERLSSEVEGCQRVWNRENADLI